MARTMPYGASDAAWRRRRYAENRAYIDAHKARHGCAHCPDSMTWPPVALDLHHVDPSTKDPAYARMAERWGRERIDAELAKCIVVCAGHHRVIDTGTRMVYVDQLVS